MDAEFEARAEDLLQRRADLRDAEDESVQRLMAISPDDVEARDKERAHLLYLRSIAALLDVVILDARRQRGEISADEVAEGTLRGVRDQLTLLDKAQRRRPPSAEDGPPDAEG